MMSDFHSIKTHHYHNFFQLFTAKVWTSQNIGAGNVGLTLTTLAQVIHKWVYTLFVTISQFGMVKPVASIHFMIFAKYLN